MAAITSKAVTGNLSVGTNWVGDVAPTTGDTIVIVSGADITVDINIELGNNASGVGIAVSISGILRISAGVTLRLKGVDGSTNKAMYIAPGGVLLPVSTSIIEVVPAAIWQTTITNEGDVIADRVTFRSGEPWTFNLSSITLSSFVRSDWSANPVRICLFVLRNAGNTEDLGVISNADQNGIGTPLDNSFTVTSINGGELTPYNALTRKVASKSLLLTTGDYFVDCGLGIVYYVDTEDKPRLSITYTVYSHKWLGFGILSVRNGDSRFIATNCRFERIGGKWDSHDWEDGYFGLGFNYRTNGVVNSLREGRISGCTFEYCIVPLRVYRSTNNVSNPINISGNTFINNFSTAGNYGKHIQVGYVQYANLENSTVHTKYAFLGAAAGRTPLTSILINSLTGTCQPSSLSASAGVTIEDCVITGLGSYGDDGGIQSVGASGSIATVKNCIISNGHRAGRINSYTEVNGCTFKNCNHHGFVCVAANSFITDIKVINNITMQTKITGDMGGGFTLGYNYTQWVNNVEVSGNTFDTGNRTICFNDEEGTKVLGTRLSIFNNIFSRARNGIVQPTITSTNQTKKQIQRLDYNNEYSFTNASNVNQGTPYISGVEYNLDATRNVIGIALFNPSTLNSTGKTLELVVSGTPGTDFSMLLSWGGGPPVQLVSAQGTATGGSSASYHTAPGTLVDSGKTWTSDSLRLDQGKIISGTGAGQYFMVRTNNATTLTTMPNNVIGNWTAPASGSVYIVLKSDVVLTDGSQTVEAGLYIPDIQLSSGIYTDSGITISSNKQTVNPRYKFNESLIPSNLALFGSGVNGGSIGAYQPIDSSTLLIGM